MMNRVKCIASWSGGKDSALALHLARQRADLEVTGLLTTFSAEFNRVSMHGVRRALLEAQADALGLPVTPMLVPTPAADASCLLCPTAQAPGFTVFPGNDDYESLLRAALRHAKSEGVEAVVFGDIYLEDLRRYREQRLAEAGMKAIFPLWGRDPRELAEAVIAAGFKAVVVCVDGARLDGGFAGRAFDADFLAALPESADPCGENGEYHTFVHDGPGFRQPVQFRIGETVHRPPFWFCDLTP